MQLYSKCIEFGEKYLESDLYLEEIYVTLVTCYAHANNISKIHSTYERCVRHIVKELDCPLSQGTMEKYNTLLRDGFH